MLPELARPKVKVQIWTLTTLLSLLVTAALLLCQDPGINQVTDRLKELIWLSNTISQETEVGVS